MKLIYSDNIKIINMHNGKFLMTITILINLLLFQSNSYGQISDTVKNDIKENPYKKYFKKIIRKALKIHKEMYDIKDGKEIYCALFDDFNSIKSKSGEFYIYRIVNGIGFDNDDKEKRIGYLKIDNTIVVIYANNMHKDFIEKCEVSQLDQNFKRVFDVFFPDFFSAIGYSSRGGSSLGVLFKFKKNKLKIVQKNVVIDKRKKCVLKKFK